MNEGPGNTMRLLERWHAGDRNALEELLARDLEWLEHHVRRRLGPVLRNRGETVDYVQDAVVEVLRYGPKFVVDGRDRFRALLARIVENSLRDKHDWYLARRRAAEREQSLPSESVLRLGATRGGATPSQAAVKTEQENWLRLALELIEPDDRQVILLREWEGMQFDEIGARLGTTSEAARKRFRRALPRVIEVIEKLKAGRVPLPSSGDGKDGSGGGSAPTG